MTSTADTYRASGRIAAFTAGLVLLVGPIFVLLLGALSRAWFFPDAFPDLSFDGFGEIGGRSRTRQALWDGLRIGGVVTAIALVVAWPAARALSRLSGRLVGAVLVVLFLPSVMPPVSLATGVAALLLRLGLSGTSFAVVIAHLVPTLPYAVAILTAVFIRHDDGVEQQARVLGATPFQVWRLVTLPLVRAGVAVATVFCFLVSWSQYLLTLLIGEGQIVTITMLVATASSGGNPRTIGVLAVLAALPATAVLLIASAAYRTTLDDGEVRA